MEDSELEYVYVLKDEKPLAENNILASPVTLTTGEANFVNNHLEANNSPNRYKLIIKENESC